MSKHWYKPTFWHWWWKACAPAGVKALAATAACALLLFGGYESLGAFSSATAAHVYTYVQTVRHVQVRAVTSTRPVTVLEHGRFITVDPPAKAVTGPALREYVTVTTSGGQGEARTVTLPVTQRDVITAAGPRQTASVIRSVPVTRTDTAGQPQPAPVTRVQTATVARTNTVTVQQAQPQSVVAARTLTETQPVTTTVTKATTVPQTTTVANEVTTTVIQPTTQTVSQTQTTTVTQTQIVTQTVVATVPVTVTIRVTT